MHAGALHRQSVVVCRGEAMIVITDEGNARCTRWRLSPLWVLPVVAVTTVAVSGAVGGPYLALLTAAASLAVAATLALQTNGPSRRVALASSIVGVSVVLGGIAWLAVSRDQGLPTESSARDSARGGDYRGADLSGEDFARADLRGADLRGATLSRSNLYGADLRGADLRGSDLRNSCLQRAVLSGVCL
jgi:hypothetical protein